MGATCGSLSIVPTVNRNKPPIGAITEFTNNLLQRNPRMLFVKIVGFQILSIFCISSNLGSSAFLPSSNHKIKSPVVDVTLNFPSPKYVAPHPTTQATICSLGKYCLITSVLPNPFCKL